MKNIGIPSDVCDSISERYADDIDGLRAYVLIARALFDDRSEYVE